MANEEIRHLERLESELMGQEKDLDEGIAQDMESYAECVTNDILSPPVLTTQRISQSPGREPKAAVG